MRRGCINGKKKKERGRQRGREREMIEKKYKGNRGIGDKRKKMEKEKIK